MPLISAEAHSAEHEKSDQIAAELSTLTSSGRARRQFLGGTALAAAGTSAALIARSLPTLAADAAEDSGRCASPAIPTPMKDVAGKVAFITGGNSGIGLGIARAFVAAGMKVAITYRTQANLDEAMTYFEKDKDRVYAVNVDVTDRAALESAADDVVKHFGKVNVVVANAGVAGGSGGISKASYDDWDWGMSVNLNGVFNTIHAFLPSIQSNGESGAVIATSSLAGLLGHPQLGVYTASKFGVVGLIESLRFELAGSNIAVSVFCPGIVSTNIGTSARNRPAQFQGKTPQPAPPPRTAARPATMSAAMDPLEAGERVLKGMRNNDLYVLTTPDFEEDFRARGEAIVASVPTDVTPSAERIAIGHRIAGKMTYVAERDRKQCERKMRAKKA